MTRDDIFEAPPDGFSIAPVHPGQVLEEEIAARLSHSPFAGMGLSVVMRIALQLIRAMQPRRPPCDRPGWEPDRCSSYIRRTIAELRRRPDPSPA